MFNLNKEYQYILLDLNNEPNIADEEPPKPVFEKKALSWEDDMQLYSKFLDRKVGETSKPGNIPQIEIKCMSRSYIKHYDPIAWSVFQYIKLQNRL